MCYRILFASFILFLTPAFLFGSDPDHPESSDQKTKMGFYEMNFGMDGRYAQYSNASSLIETKTNAAFGISGRMQSSFAGYFNRHNKFLIGDLLSAELAAGGLSSYYSNAISNIWLSYRFEFGLGMIYRINKKNDVGLNLMLLRFASDKVSQNMSGSSVVIRYRYSKVMIEGGVETRRDRIVGWINDIQSNIPLQGTLSCKYLLNEKKNAGIRCEFLPAKITVNNESFNNILSIRLFYGIYF